MKVATVLPALLLAGLAADAVVSDADAGFLRRRGPEPGYVVAESRHGNGTVSGPVRIASTGYEVRLPGGTWVACRTSCSETLRVETIDYWENDGRMIGGGTVQNECGIFGCLDIRYPR
jgi:hypothetical protein